MTAPDPWAPLFEPLGWPSFAERLVALDRALDAAAVDVCSLLDGIPLDVWGALLLDPRGHLPANGDKLPSMPSDDVQLEWTGGFGAGLLRQSLAFVRSLLSLAGPLAEAPVLDFGVGWGRISRLLLKYVPSERLHGADVLQSTIDLARSTGLSHPMHLVSSRLQPDELPERFGTVYSLSVFTHLSPEAFVHGLGAIHERLLPGGRFVFTTRTPEFWAVSASGDDGRADATRSEGIVHVPHTSDYGDTAVTDSWLTAQLAEHGFEDVTSDWNHCDPYQHIWAATRH